MKTHVEINHKAPKNSGLSPVSPVRLTQYCPVTTSASTSKAPSTHNMEEPDMFSQISPTQKSKTTTPPHVINPNVPLKSTTTTHLHSTLNTIQSQSINKIRHLVFPQQYLTIVVQPTHHTATFQTYSNVVKEKSLQKGEKSKLPSSPEPTQNQPILDKVLSTDLISNEDLDSISYEFDNSWNEDSPPKSTHNTVQFTPTPTKSPQLNGNTNKNTLSQHHGSTGHICS